MTGLFIGTSGWSYKHWKDSFFQGVPQKRWLEHCAGRFTGLEVNATFYRHLKPETYAGWRDRTPEGFAFAVKGHRQVTHVKKLTDVAEPVARMRDAIAPMGARLRVVFWQLPPNLQADADRLRTFAEGLREWPGVRHAVEFRHPSWFTEETAALLAEHDLANVISDAAKWDRWDAVTTDLVFLRLHGRPQTYASAYGDDGLASWADGIRRWRAEGREVHCYFDNDFEGHAPYDALRLMDMLGVAPVAQGGETG